MDDPKKTTEKASIQLNLVKSSKTDILTMLTPADLIKVWILAPYEGVGEFAVDGLGEDGPDLPLRQHHQLHEQRRRSELPRRPPRVRQSRTRPSQGAPRQL